MQKYNPLPIKGAQVRFDARAKKWGVINPKDKKISQHFDLAIMKNVLFHGEIMRESSGCGGTSETHIGIATGDLYLHKTCDVFDLAKNENNPTQFNSLGFSGGKFHNQSGREITEAKELVLMPGRKSYYLN